VPRRTATRTVRRGSGTRGYGRPARSRERTVGRTFDDFRAYWQGLSLPVRQVPVFALLFGETNQAEMTALAQLTNGKTFDARTGSPASAFKEVRGYQ